MSASRKCGTEKGNGVVSVTGGYKGGRLSERPLDEAAKKPTPGGKEL